MQEDLREWAIKYPIPGGLLVMTIGAFMIYDGLMTGRHYSRFSGGEEVAGTVVDLRRKSTTLPRYEMTVSWRDSAQTLHSAVVDATNKEFDSLRKGTPVALLVAKDDPGAVLVAKRLDHQNLMTPGGVPVTGIALAGIAMAVFGLGYALWGWLRKPKPYAGIAITRRALKVYRAFGGDLDGFARIASDQDRAAISTDLWYRIDALLHDMRIVKSGQASKQFKRQLARKLAQAVENQDVIKQLWELTQDPPY